MAKQLEASDNETFACWLVWQKAEDGGRPYLVAVDLSPEKAQRHKEAALRQAQYEGKTIMIQIEESQLNHLYGETMGQGFDRLRDLVREMRAKGKGG